MESVSHISARQWSQAPQTSHVSGAHRGDYVDHGGYDSIFVEAPPEGLKCVICLHIAKQPQQHGGCGKLFCKSCITTYQLQRKDCPHCRRLTTFGGQTTILNDFKSDQEVKSLKVHCQLSCGWTGELRAMEDHLRKTCAKAEVPCPNLCDNGTKKVRRENLLSHLQKRCPKRQVFCPQCKQQLESQELRYHTAWECPKRQYKCPKCGELGCYDERTTHLTVCPMVTTPCPKCFVPILSCDRPNHHKICLYEPVSCKYYTIGCTEKPLRKDLDKHEDDAQLHLKLATEKICELTLATSRNTVTFKVRDFRNKQETSKDLYGPHFYTSDYKLCIRVLPIAKVMERTLVFLCMLVS